MEMPEKIRTAFLSNRLMKMEIRQPMTVYYMRKNGQLKKAGRKYHFLFENKLSPKVLNHKNLENEKDIN